MRNRSRASWILLLLSLVVSGCGAGANQDVMRQSVRKVAGIVATYNGSKKGDVASTGRACDVAFIALKRQRGPMYSSALPASRPAAQALRRAYTLAVAGFRDCARGGLSRDYTAMEQSDAELAQANQWIVTSRSLDH